MFVRNAWYVAAWETEIGDTPLARTILNEPVVMFRTGDSVVALEDRCCHRALPLSMGQVVGDHIRCGYHGLEFDAAGACVKVPGSRHKSATTRLSPPARTCCVSTGRLYHTTKHCMR